MHLKCTRNNTFKSWLISVTFEIKALTALEGGLSLSVGWENGPEQGFKTVSFNR